MICIKNYSDKIILLWQEGIGGKIKLLVAIMLALVIAYCLVLPTMALVGIVLGFTAVKAVKNQGFRRKLGARNSGAAVAAFVALAVGVFDGNWFIAEIIRGAASLILAAFFIYPAEEVVQGVAGRSFSAREYCAEMIAYAMAGAKIVRLYIVDTNP